MFRSRRGKEAFHHLKAGIAVVFLLGLLLGAAAGMKEISANAYIDQGLSNIALSAFVEELNESFFRFVIVALPVVVFLYLLGRVAPRSFRMITSILVLLLLILLLTRHSLYLGAPGGEESLFGDSGRLVGLRFLLLLLSLGAARLFYEGFPLGAKVLRVFSLNLVVVILFLLAAANSARYINHTKNFPRGQNVILITADGIRPDHLGCYGYTKETSPQIDRLQKEGILFTSAFTPSPRSQQALASILTGRDPIQTGVRRMWDTLDPKQITLAEYLKDKGYDTAAFYSPVAGLFLPGEDKPFLGGLDQGFDHFVFSRSAGGGSRRLTDEAITWIVERETRPFFLWVHLSDPEMPYDPPEQDRRFGEAEGSFSYFPDRPCRVFGHEPLPEEEMARAIALYDGEIHQVDSQVGRLIARLTRGERIHDSLILLAGAHGESLGEHDYFFDHGDFLYDTCIRVPLLVSAANLPTRIITSQVRLFDLLPTLLEILHYPLPPETDGRSLMLALERPEAFSDLPVTAESGVSLFPRHNRRRPVGGMEGKATCLRTGPWKLIRYPEPGGAERWELYDLDADPDELWNVWADSVETGERLRSELQKRTAGLSVSTSGNENPPPSVLSSPDAIPAEPPENRS